MVARSCHKIISWIFALKTKKGPWKSRTFLLGCKIVPLYETNAPFRLREAQHHWCEASHRLRLAATSFARSATSFICAEGIRNDVLALLEMMLTFGQRMLCLRHKWKNPSLSTWIFWLPELGSKTSVASKALRSNASSDIVQHSPKAKLTVVCVANIGC